MNSKLLVLGWALLAGCGTLATRGLFSEVQARRPAGVQLGRELVLTNTPPRHATSFISVNGSAHAFLIDPQKQLRHLEVSNDEIVVNEIVGTVEDAAPFALDAVRTAAGEFRVLAGDKQFVRNPGQSVWREIKGNRCRRFFSAAENLWCAFVISGEEIGAPARKDWTIGWFILMPLAWWSNTQGAKLVLAELAGESWTIRAVLDGDSPLDADRNFMAEMDEDGNLHLLYFNVRGGGLFALAVGAAPGAVGGGFKGPTPDLKYARVKLDRLIARAPADSQAETPSAMPTSREFITGSNVSLRTQLSRLSTRCALNMGTGDISALSWGRLTLVPGAGMRRLVLDGDSGDCCSWVETRVRDGSWAADEVVATSDLPDSDYDWWSDDAALLRSDAHGHLHALLERSRAGFWSPSHFMAYFTKTGEGWSAPVILGSSHGDATRTFAVSSTGVSFAAWVDKEGRFVGRWIARKLIEHDQQTLQPEVSYAVRQGICFAGASSGDNEQGISAQHALRAALPKTRPRGYCSFAGRLVTSTRIHLAFEPCRANASK